jgi:hypothetical protein
MKVWWPVKKPSHENLLAKSLFIKKRPALVVANIGPSPLRRPLKLETLGDVSRDGRQAVESVGKNRQHGGILHTGRSLGEVIHPVQYPQHITKGCLAACRASGFVIVNNLHPR